MCWVIFYPDKTWCDFLQPVFCVCLNFALYLNTHTVYINLRTNQKKNFYPMMLCSLSSKEQCILNVTYLFQHVAFAPSLIQRSASEHHIHFITKNRKPSEQMCSPGTRVSASILHAPTYWRTNLKEGTGNPWAGQGKEKPVPSFLTMVTPCSPEIFGDSLDNGSSARELH